MSIRALALTLCLASMAALAALPVRGASLCPGLAGVSPTPPGMLERVGKAFGIAAQAVQNSVVRCDGSRLLACATGANLNCGLADSRRGLPGAVDYCRATPNSDFIPMFATGHATIYDWKCSGGRPVAGKTVVSVDSQGYAAQNWREVR